MRRDTGNAGAAQPLPILVFDERRLTPSFGYVFKRQWLDPHESIVSILWKFARMNGLSGQAVATQVAKTTIDPYDGIEPKRDTVDIRRLSPVLGLRLKQLRASLIPRSLEHISSRYFRYCSRCLERGYHGVLHQLEPLQLCPMHGSWLQTDCRNCHQPSPYRLNARLLDTPFRCGNCRQLYANCSPSLESRQALSCRALVALTRTRLRYAA